MNRLVVEDTPCIDIRRLTREHVIEPGVFSDGLLSLAHGATVDYTAAFDRTPPMFRLSYLDGRGEHVFQEFPLVSTPMPTRQGDYPRPRWWFVANGVRCAILHQVPGGRFAPRRVHGLRYKSQRLSTRRRRQLRLRRHRARYDNSAETSKPHRVRTHTWQRWLARLHELQRRLDQPQERPSQGILRRLREWFGG